MPVDLSPHATLRWISSVAALTFSLLSPAAADAPSSACTAIGRDLAASADAAGLTTEPALLTGLLDPKQNQGLEPLTGFTSAEYYKNADALRTYLNPALVSAKALTQLPLSDTSLLVHDLRTSLDRVVAIWPSGGREDACQGVAVLRRDRASQEILPAPAFKCDGQSARLVQLRDHGHFVALLDLVPTPRQGADPTPERHYRLVLHGVGAVTEMTQCSFDLAFDGARSVQPSTARTMRDAALSAMWQISPAPDDKAIRDWLGHHQSALVAAYLDHGRNASTAMAWPADVTSDNLTPAPPMTRADPRDCGIGKPIPAAEAIRSIVTSISDLGGLQCKHVLPDHLVHGRVKTAMLDFLVAIAVEQNTIVLTGFAWNPSNLTAQLAAFSWIRQTPTGRLLGITAMPTD